MCHVLLGEFEVIEIFTEDIIHHMLKDNKCIGKAKGHHNIFKIAVTSFECHLPFITFSNAHQVVCST
jgi:hypothetical protein